MSRSFRCSQWIARKCTKGMQAETALQPMHSASFVLHLDCCNQRFAQTWLLNTTLHTNRNHKASGAKILVPYLQILHSYAVYRDYLGTNSEVFKNQSWHLHKEECCLIFLCMYACYIWELSNQTDSSCWCYLLPSLAKCFSCYSYPAWNMSHPISVNVNCSHGSLLEVNKLLLKALESMWEARRWEVWRDRMRAVEWTDELDWVMLFW